MPPIKFRLNRLLFSALSISLSLSSVSNAHAADIAVDNKIALTSRSSIGGSSSVTLPSTLQKGQEAAKLAVTGDVLLDAMNKELARSFAQLKSLGTSPLYFLSYRVYDTEDINLTASYGAIESDGQNRRRILDVEARVGDMKTDSSHKLRGDFDAPIERFFLDSRAAVEFSLDDDEPAIRTALWLVTDDAFKRAQRNLIQGPTTRRRAAW